MATTKRGLPCVIIMAEEECRLFKEGFLLLLPGNAHESSVYFLLFLLLSSGQTFLWPLLVAARYKRQGVRIDLSLTG